MIASGFSWFHLVPGVEDGSLVPFAPDHHAYLFVSACFVSGLLIVFGLLARMALQRKLASAEGIEQFHADEGFTVFTMAEGLVEFLRGMQNGLLDKAHQRRWTPLIGALFTYIFLSNILSLVPGFQPPTDNINTNVGMALIVMVTYWAVGLISDPKSFIAHITGPVAVMAPLIGAIELLGLLVIRPVTLSLRLTGNMFADHTVFGVISGLVPLVVPVPFLVLAIVVSTIQAFVFTLLTTIYISLSLPHGDHGDHHDHH
ncbi:MAG: F0F1 ATP synthase subunit A [Alphaproteobacteria bacterium]|nr:F0F1 ATP synthase subunit A [Alphaproteobacteria bacterium]